MRHISSFPVWATTSEKIYQSYHDDGNRDYPGTTTRRESCLLCHRSLKPRKAM